MHYFYFLSLIPIVVALVFSQKRAVVWWEVVVSTALVFAVAGAFHWGAIRSQTGDYETWSGVITRGVHYPRWVEEETHQVTDYDSKGKAKGSHTEHTYTTHSEHWEAETSIGDKHEIASAFFAQITERFKDLTTETPYKTGFYSGDRHIYVAYNRSGFVYPINGWKSFQNRLRAQPNLFQFAKPPATVRVYDYPANKDWLLSDRLVGPIRSKVDSREFELMNARLGPAKRVNVILVGFKGQDSSIGQYQQAAWFGGRKNDLVLCFDADGDTPQWAYCFGWTEREDVKRNLEALAMESGVNTASLPAIEKEIATNYVIKNWHKFDYISIPPPTWAMWWFPVALIITQGLYWFWAFNNEFESSPFAGVAARVRTFNARYPR